VDGEGAAGAKADHRFVDFYRFGREVDSQRALYIHLQEGRQALIMLACCSEITIIIFVFDLFPGSLFFRVVFLPFSLIFFLLSKHFVGGLALRGLVFFGFS
jgi:hypothetical protein